MKFKNLLSLSVMLSCGLVTQAQQVFQEPFDAEQTKGASDVAFYEFINQEEGDNWKISDGGFKGKALFLNNDAGTPNDNATWRRAVKFRNLPLQEGKSYRLTYYLKGNASGAKARVSLMQGVENADIPVGSQADITNIGSEFTKYSHVYYFKSKAEQDAEYDKQCASKEAYNAANKDKYFATFNIYNPGEFFLDEVTLEEAAIAGASYKGDVICVDFGHPTNASSLATQTASGNYLLDNSVATVTVGGKAVEILTVELRKDGKLYIFLADPVNNGEVKVTFKNPDGLIKCNDGFELTEFTETADPNSNLSDDLISDIYSEPSLESVTPLDGSFALETKDLKTITLTFDKKVHTKKNDIKSAAPKATLSTGTELTLKTTEELSNTLTFEYNGPELAKGTYSIIIENIASEYTEGADITLTYEIGKVQLAETKYTLLADQKTQTAEEGGIPDGWKLTLEKDGVAEEHNGGSGSRGFLYTNSNVQSAVYMRDWEGKPVLTCAPVKIAKGDAEIRVFTAGWGTTGGFKMTLKNAAGEEVLSEKIAVSTQLNKDRTGNFQVNPFRFVSDGGEYTYSIELDGGNELLTAGFEVYSYVEGEGDKAEVEVIAKSDFGGVGADYTPAHGTGWKIYRNDNRMRDPGANCNWGGDDWTGGGGPRIKNIGNKGMNGASIYLAGGCYATYGEYDVQTDHGGPLAETQPEKTLDLDAARYQITYNFIGWKNPGETYNIQLDIYKFEDGIGGTPVYTRIDGTTVCCGSGGDASSEATKVQFLWNAPAKGKYILKFTASGAGEGEAVLGNVSVETTASLAIQYAEQMNKNLEPAKEELAKAKADEKYKGATRDALEKTIKDYTNPDFHTADQYADAFVKLDAIVKKSEKRRANIDGFASALEAVKNALDAAKETKFEKLPQFPIVEKAYADYKDVDCVALNDDDLDKAVSVMKQNGNLLKNMVESCVPLITKQITDLAAAIVALDEESANNETVIAAGNAISDDQSLVAKLKYIYTSKLYKKIASGNPFKSKDADTGDEVDVTLPASFLISNANFYSTAIIPAGKQSVDAKVTDFPGWTVEIVKGAISPVFNTAWGEQGASDVKPYADNGVKTVWGTHEYDVKQLIEDIPVAKYTASIKVGEDGGDPHGSYAYLGEGEAQKQIAYEGGLDENGQPTNSYSRDEKTPRTFADITTAAGGNGGNFGSILLGAHINVASGFGMVDDATLTITGKADNFDYAKAAAAIDEIIATDIATVEAAPAGEPTSVKYYTVDGKQTLNPQGITIKVESWANGYVKVSKVVK